MMHWFKYDPVKIGRTPWGMGNVPVQYIRRDGESGFIFGRYAPWTLTGRGAVEHYRPLFRSKDDADNFASRRSNWVVIEVTFVTRRVGGLTLFGWAVVPKPVEVGEI